MPFLRGLTWIYAFYAIGELVSKQFSLPVPGAVIGLLLLWIALRTGLVKADWVRDGAQGLLSVLGLLFVPAGAGIAAYASPAWLSVIAAVLMLTALGISTVGLLVQRAVRR